MRLSIAKRTFNWTEELLTVEKCIETRPPVYLIKDDHGEILEGTFYSETLQKVTKKDDVLSMSHGAIRKTDTSNRDASLL